MPVKHVQHLISEPLAKSWHDPAKALAITPSKEFEAEAIRTFQAAKVLLSEQLKQGFYKATSKIIVKP